MVVITKQKKYILITASVTFILLLCGGMFVLANRSSSRQETKTDPSVFSQRVERRVLLEVISQPVFIQMPGETTFKPAKNGMEVPVGSTVRTDENARAQLLFSDKAITRLDESTEIRVEEADLQTESFRLFI